MAPRDSPPQLVSVAQAADYLGVCTKTVRRYVATGRLTKYRVGSRLVRLDAYEVEALLRSDESL
jgi:excisionase family DNA binding protein